MFSSVVVGVKELEAGRDALSLARALTSAQGNLTLAHVHVVALKPAPDSGAAGSAARRRDGLEYLAALRDESHIDAEVVCDEARNVRHGLDDIAAARKADLLVIGASHNDVIYRDLVGDDARDLLEDAPCAVAVAPVGCAERQGPLRRIGVAYDGSPESERALALARKLAADRHAKLSAFQVLSGPGRIEDTIDDEVAKAHETLEKLDGVDTYAKYGEPAGELRDYGRSLDLLVLGSRRHSPLGGLLGRGTAQRLVDEPPCPLLVLAQD